MCGACSADNRGRVDSFNEFDGLGRFDRFSGTARGAMTPLGFQSKSVDTEFAEELEMVAQIVVHLDSARRRGRRAAAHQALDAIEDSGGHPILALERDWFVAVLTHERHSIGVDVEAAIWL